MIFSFSIEQDVWKRSALAKSETGSKPENAYSGEIEMAIMDEEDGSDGKSWSQE